MRNLISYILFALLFASCSANKFLPEGEKYFEGHESEYLGKSSSKVPKDVKYYLQEDLKPESTRRFFISRPGIWIYEIMGEPKKDKGVRHWIKYKLGKEPIYLSAVNIDKNTSMIESKLNNNGFFRGNVKSRVDSTTHKATVAYIITPGEPYYFDSLKICTDSINLCSKIKKAHELEPIIKHGNLFQKMKMQEEREMIAKYFKNDGYFYFVPELTYFEADSANDDQTVKLHLEMNEFLPEAAISQYTISSVTVNLAAGSANTETIGDSLKVIIDPDRLFLKPKKLAPFIQITPGELYRRKDEETTLKQLNRLEVFEFVNVHYEPDTTGGKYTLKASLLANPRPKQSARAELNVSTTSTNFTGPGVQLEYYNRNIFRGAEKLRITGTGRYEKQLTGANKGVTSYDLDLQAALLIPRVGLPVFQPDDNEGNVPSTKYRVQYRLYSQPDYYTQSSFGASFGYEWQGGKSTFNDLRVMGVDYVKLLRTSDRLEQLFDDGILTRESFADQIIVGPSYSMTYAPRSEKGKFIRFYFGGSIESAGNILYGAYSAISASKNDLDQYTFINTPFAQFMRIQGDFRTYYKLSKNNDLVLRQNIGVGLPYWNSSELPFSKQFFVGGASSLRGFQPRSLGPGTYYNSDQKESGYFDQTGDILLELNIENRFDMGGFLKGAVFVDAGNVWLKNESESRPGGDFKFDSFFSQLAVSAGVGLRIDVEFVLIRFDLAFPIRKPYMPDGERWVVKDIDFGKSWRKDNLVLNIAIGYPF